MTPEIDPHPDHLRLVEALLFASAAPLDEVSLQQRLPEGTDVGALIAELEAHYRGRGVNLVRVANGWTLRTAPDLAPRLNLERKVPRKLSRAAVETLAIIAYHQPVTRAEIESIRGVIISKGTLDTLMEVGWIAPKGRKQTVGRPVTWATTDDFLLHFGLADIADLPGIEELRAAGLIGGRAVTTLSETVRPTEVVRDERDEDEQEEEREPEPEPRHDEDDERPEGELATAAAAPEAGAAD
ncbi:MAG TPA: SMC-Scp complex subunit ScpB [Stellaceae bacterium]|nr:SMC-Scp complex subunit ScpB [Stellaceae bacterium]